jgi:hypothetical protein
MRYDGVIMGSKESISRTITTAKNGSNWLKLSLSKKEMSINIVIIIVNNSSNASYYVVIRSEMADKPLLPITSSLLPTYTDYYSTWDPSTRHWVLDV